MMPPRIDASASTLCGRTLRSRAIRGGTLPERRDTPDTRTPSSTSLCTDGVCDYELLVFADDPELQCRDDTGRQADRHFVLAERLDGLIELHPAVIDLDVRALELLLDVTRGDRAEQLLVLAGLPLELERHAADASREVVGDRALLGTALLDERLLVTENGSSASMRARRIAVEIVRCWRADAPEMRRGIILPRSVTNERSTWGFL